MFQTPVPRNEPVKGYAPGSPERAGLQAELDRQAAEVVEIPCVVGGERIYTGQTVDVVMPCDHRHVLARAHLATPELVARSCDSVCAAQAEWAALPWQERAAVLLRMAELLAGPWRHRLNAATMLGQGKTSHQAEIDSACEVIDFWRFNSAYARQLMTDQPQSAPGVWNRVDHRPLEGFVFAVTPFNFTSIALNLPTAPVLMGNVAIWKPATTQLHAAWVGYQLFEEAGLPPGVIDFLPGRGATVGDPVMADRRLAGLHFTGSTATFQHLWRTVARNLDRYRSYPRIVGETGGKDFILAHQTADVDALAVAIARGGFEYQGQKCSAASRIYIPDTLWPEVRDRVVDIMGQMRMGDVRDWSTFVGAVIDGKAFASHSDYLRLAHSTARVIAGGEADDSTGWYVQPTLVEVEDPKHRLMQEEIFGPIVTAWVYPADRWTEVLRTVDETSPYALTGAIFARDRYAIQEALAGLRHAAGNFYVNDKPTGAVVGQQPFGGGRASGTNDKAGSVLNLLRWVSPRTIKENFHPPHDWRYPYLGEG
ncbi:MAG: L-glutamate gamma-semialdehyde dehydrogenase [Deltaproteobacteria bacterium]|nr:MAG: L-glutamate gamma-semialdehyde dehydrogenase [Deltaproteobacteria bacterium]